ncbi:3-hydroxy-3-methylglutaryl coenzyme A reductase-like protein [Legionella busanensis]|uniref:3-hydroxy-3-methylglutaryl coenzyme A reductase-like protein n=1 Tax=Legionella busanensis TaxID=190655 RepID=A0A378JQI5_9GAMM|nr:3-hydroxy-3-methylglutaryl-CoA reductase [Legionella busanensis]STX52439.1 3-hydroxy-3-methylglutaryl coenzyme A reductase-like protein [Legionella busanensis]
MQANFIEASPSGLVFTKDFFEFCLRKQLNNPDLIVEAVNYIPSSSEKMTLELKHPKKGELPIGVQHYHLCFINGETKKNVELLVKSKISEQHYLQAITQAFEKCGITTESPLINYLSQLEFRDVNNKEVAVYKMQKEHAPFNTFLPTCYGYYLNEDEGACILILQYLSDEYLSFDPFDVEKWDRLAIDYYIKALAQLHAVWFGKTKDLITQAPSFKNILNAHKMQEFMPYWAALAKAVEKAKLPFLNETDYIFHQQLISNLNTWWQFDTMQKTLVQNDCVPKNVGLNLTKQEVYIYDWEIATAHVPQRDLVEFLAYVLPSSFDEALLTHYIECHRHHLIKYSQQDIDKSTWRLGFLYTVYDYLIQRVLPQLVFEQLEARNIEKIYKNARRMINILLVGE